ncbi:MAG: inner-rane translocator [Herminiimonas sp.]|nr:inner-rane translocator [Herminiimonas sp.]
MLSFDVIIAGLAIGSMYGLLALGYHITHIVSNTVNFSQGASLMVGAVVAYTMHVTWGLPLAVAIVGSILVCALLGLLIHRIVVAPFSKNGSIAWLMSTIAFGIILENAVMLTFGKESRSMPSPLPETPIRMFGAGVYPLEIVVPLVGLGCALALTLFLKRTLLGKALLAAAQNRDAAMLQGIAVSQLTSIAYMVSTSMAGIAGMLIAPKLNVYAGMGTMFGLKAFAVAIIGGMDSALGIMVAGLLYGLAEAAIASVLPSAYREIIGFGFVIVVLAIKPQGLFGRLSAQKV